MRWGVRGRIRKDADRDVVTVEVRMCGRLFRWLLAINGVLSQGLFFGLLLFGIAGTTDWPRAWLFIASWCVFILAVCTLSSTEVMIERLWPLRDIRGLDRSDLALGLLFGPLVVAWLVLLPVDRFHLELFARPPAVVSICGLLLMIIGFGFMTLSVRQNQFASPVVKLMDGQRVIDHGVYSVVRHPMYFGAALFVVGLSLWLESYAATLWGLVLVVGLALRIRIEERVLGGLTGYEAYTHRVRHRLVPFVW